jgi:signal transduction histidine kinase
MPDLSGIFKRLGFAALGQTTFRRILLSRILLLSVPVLLLGEYVTYRKARSGLLETARQNLAESAVRKGERIEDSIKGLQARLLSASQTAVLESGDSEASKQFLEQLAQQLPDRVQCVQLENLQTGEMAWSSCGNQRLDSPPASVWPAVRESAFTDASAVKITAFGPGETSQKAAQRTGAAPGGAEGQFSMVLSAPVYDLAGQLVYALKIQADLIQPETDKRRSLSGYTVVIAQDGTILAHPNARRVGRKISEEKDKESLQSILGNAIAGNTYFIHLFGFEDGGGELLAGYTAIPSPVVADRNQKWIVLAVTRLDNALAGLEEIQHVLVTLILGLLAANLLATLYLSRDIARPLEQLGDYALRVQARRSLARVPHNFRIREFNQLASALDSMVERLTAWAEELETAWKEAKVANELKNQFLANTSHELRTPLNAIINCIRLVRDGSCDDEEEKMEFLQLADDAAIHLLDIINDVLDIAKIEAGTLSVVLQPVDMQKVLEEVIDLQAAEIKNKGLQLILPERQAPIAVEADPVKLKQILLNVVGNALKFTDTGSIAISTRIEPVENGQAKGSTAAPASSAQERYAIVSVRDTGIGIDPNHQHRLFEPFVTIDSKYGGTGLGLAISRNLIELMKGSITLHSAGAGLGTTVEISLPILDLLPVSSDKLQV